MAILLLDNYDSFTYNLFQVTQAETDEPVEVIRNDAIDFAGIAARGFSRIIISPGPGHPAVASDFGVCREVVTRQEDLGCPILGVCLGHQGIVHYSGGNVVRAPRIVHGKSSVVTVTRETPIFAGLPERFEAMRYHSLVAAEDDFPESLVVTAREESLGLVMALQHRTRPIFGVQFHPESIGTPEGAKILRNFVEYQQSH